MMKRSPTSGFDAMAPENISPLVVWLGSAESRDVTGCRSSRSRAASSASPTAGATGPSVDKGARWEPGRDRRRACASCSRKAVAAAEGLRDLSRACSFAFTDEQEDAARARRAPSSPSTPPSRAGARARWRASAATTPSSGSASRRARLAGRERSRRQYGGLGLGSVELVALLEEMGAALLCAPFFSTRLPRRATRCSSAASDGAASASGCRRSPRAARIATLARRRGERQLGRRRRSRRVARRDGGDFVLDGREALRARRPLRRSVLVAARREGSARRRRASRSSRCPRRRPGVERRALADDGPDPPPRRGRAARRARARPRRCSARKAQALAGARSARSTSPRSRSPPSRSAARSAASISPSPTRRSACSSAGRSARSRRSSTSAPT